MATATITYRKTKTGEWVAYGPATDINVGSVLVAKKDGTLKQEIIERVGRTFTVSGVDMVYGYINRNLRTRPARRDPWATPRTAAGRCTCHGTTACLDD